MRYEHIEATVEPGTIIAILGDQISSKEKGDKYFSNRCLGETELAEKFWKELVEFTNRYFETRIINKEYPAIKTSRRELVVGEKLNRS